MCDQSCLTLCDPVDCSLPGSSVHGDSPRKNTGVGCRFLFQGIFLTKGSNLCLLRFLQWQADSLPLHCLGSYSVSSSGGHGRAPPPLLPPGQRICINPSEFCCREIFLSWACVHSAIYLYSWIFILFFGLQSSTPPPLFYFALRVPTFTTESSFSEFLCAFHVPPGAFLSFF